MPSEYDSSFYQTPVLLGSTPTVGQIPQYAGGYNFNPITLPDTKNILDFGADPTGSKDSSTAIQAAINALAKIGGIVYCPAGTYLINSQINIGNGAWGASGTGTTNAPVMLMGARAVQEQGSDGAFTQFTINTGAVGIQFNGRLEGGGLKNLWIVKGGTSTFGVVMNDTANTLIEDCCIWNFPNTGLLMRTLSSTASASKRNTIQRSTFIVPDVNGAMGLHLSGTGTQDTYYDRFQDVAFAISVGGTNTVRGVYIDLADSCVFDHCSFQITNSHTNVQPVVLDFGVAAQFPSDITFVNTDWDTGSYDSATGGITQFGTPSSQLKVNNRVIANMHENGYPANPLLANLVWEGVLAKNGAPVAADVPVGTAQVIRDTSANNTVKLYYNNAGTLISTVAFA